jgi:outer membrane protein assembly factor BamA
VLKLAGVKVGDPFTDKTVAEITARLRQSGKFDSVDVRKRYASIDDMTQISIVIIASEGAVRIDLPDKGVPGPAQIKEKTVFGKLMFMPILDAEDGYGFTYGVRVAYPGLIGPKSRLSFPLSWGGTRRAGVELDRTFDSGLLTRIEVGGEIKQKTNPAFEIDDQRRRVWARAERRLGPVRLGATGGWHRVSFEPVIDRFKSIGGDVVLDTRLDPILPRNAVYIGASIERLKFDAGGTLDRTRVDARGYVGLFGQHVLVLRALREDVDKPAPVYLRSLLGGWSNLRGFEAGFDTGDTLVAGSIEWRMPITSPLSVGKLGVSAFLDVGTAYDKGELFKDQTLHQGVGGGVWIALTGFRMGLSVAHGKGSGTRVNFGGGLTF